MSELQTISKSDKPVTVASLTEELKTLGIHPAMTLLVHSSLSSLGWVCGGAVTVIQALQSALGPEGTLVMPTHSGDLSEPSYWRNPPVPESWWETIRNEMPAFDLALTPTRCMGMIPETFRKQSGVVRSGHPQTSFAAFGPHAEQITANHSLENGFGENTPLARLYDLNASILLLGVTHQNNTSLHLSESRANYPGKTTHQEGAPILVNNVRQWKTFEIQKWNDDDFPQLGEAMEQETDIVQIGQLGNAESRLMPTKECVDYGVRWMEQERGG